MNASTLKRVLITTLFIMLLPVMFASYRLAIYYYESDLRAGISAFKSGSFSLAKIKILPYAKNNNRLAQRHMAEIYAFGLAGDEDFDVAVAWLKLSSTTDLEFATKSYYIGLDFLEPHGLHAEIDKDKAIYWLKLSKGINGARNIKGSDPFIDPPVLRLLFRLQHPCHQRSE